MTVSTSKRPGVSAWAIAVLGAIIGTGLGSCVSPASPGGATETREQPAPGDAAQFGDRDNELFWTREQKIASYRNMDSIAWTRTVPAGGDPYPLPRAERKLGEVTLSADGDTMTVDEYVRRQDVAGLIVIKDGRIMYERYELGNQPTSRWISYSVAKSVTSLLIGAAIRDGYIESVDEPVTNYLPRLRESPYEEVTIRNVLQMASGVEWDETYSDPESDINKVTWNTLQLYDYLRRKRRVAPPGRVFNYNTAETNLVGTLLRAAIGNNLSTYLSETIWRPFGMEHDAYWELSEPGGGEFGGSSLNATLRDYARIGIFALREGRLPNGESVLPDGWMAESTTPSAGYARYGYLWWLRDNGAFAAAGIFGQGIYVDPAEQVVIAIHSARENASLESDWNLQYALYAALTKAVSE